MTGAELEKAHQVRHYQDVAGQAREDRRLTDEARRKNPYPSRYPTPVSMMRRYGKPERRHVCDCGRYMVLVGEHGWACPEIMS